MKERTKPASIILELWVQPGARSEGVEWDAWRQRYVVRVQAAAQKGAANEAVLRLISERLQVAPDRLAWVRAGSSRAKSIRVLGMDPALVEARLPPRGVAR